MNYLLWCNNFILLLLCAVASNGSWLGMYEVSDPYCMPCNNPNTITGVCGCPFGTESEFSWRVINDCAEALHGGNIGGCYNSSQTDSFMGGYQQDDSGNCRAANSYTGGCSCPGGTTPYSLRTIVDVPGGFDGSNLVVCTVNPLTTTSTFGGLFQQDDPVAGGRGCRLANPVTGACSCPSGTYEQAVRVIADGTGGQFLGSWIYICGQATPPPGIVTLCTGVQVDASGQTDASGPLQQCINYNYNGVLEIPPGIYAISQTIEITQPITIRTLNTENQPLSCYEPTVACATLQATQYLYNATTGGMIVLNSPNIILDHIIIDGNRNNRLNSQASADCVATNGNRATAYNGLAYNCVNCAFTNSISMNALCGTGFQWIGPGTNFTNSVFRANGNHFDGRWSDGLTLLDGTSAIVKDCLFVDNTDVNLIIGSGQNANIVGNTITMMEQHAFAGFMMDNFDGSEDGNFNGLVFFSNTVDCVDSQCDFAIEVGPHPWYQSANIYGGVLTGNTVSGGGVEINVFGGGTASDPITIYGNNLLNVPPTHQFLCGTKPGSVMNIAPDSFVERKGETFPVTNIEYTCP